MLINLAFLGFDCVKNPLPKGKKKKKRGVWGYFFSTCCGWEFAGCSTFPPRAGVQRGRKSKTEIKSIEININQIHRNIHININININRNI